MHQTLRQIAQGRTSLITGDTSHSTFSAVSQGLTGSGNADSIDDLNAMTASMPDNFADLLKGNGDFSKILSDMATQLNVVTGSDDSSAIVKSVVTDVFGYTQSSIFKSDQKSEKRMENCKPIGPFEDLASVEILNAVAFQLLGNSTFSADQPRLISLETLPSLMDVPREDPEKYLGQTLIEDLNRGFVARFAIPLSDPLCLLVERTEVDIAGIKQPRYQFSINRGYFDNFVLNGNSDIRTFRADYVVIEGTENALVKSLEDAFPLMINRIVTHDRVSHILKEATHRLKQNIASDETLSDETLAQTRAHMITFSQAGELKNVLARYQKEDTRMELDDELPTIPPIQMPELPRGTLAKRGYNDGPPARMNALKEIKAREKYTIKIPQMPKFDKETFPLINDEMAVQSVSLRTNGEIQSINTADCMISYVLTKVLTPPEENQTDYTTTSRGHYRIKIHNAPEVDIYNGDKFEIVLNDYFKKMARNVESLTTVCEKYLRCDGDYTAPTIEGMNTNKKVNPFKTRAITLKAISPDSRKSQVTEVTLLSPFDQANINMEKFMKEAEYIKKKKSTKKSFRVEDTISYVSCIDTSGIIRCCNELADMARNPEIMDTKSLQELTEKISDVLPESLKGGITMLTDVIQGLDDTKEMDLSAEAIEGDGLTNLVGKFMQDLLSKTSSDAAAAA